MVIETEVKFRLKCSFSEFLNRIHLFKPIYVEEYLETDTYYNHPCRDFKKSDEALRLRTRCSSSGRQHYLTYKSSRFPSVNVKKRIEYEIVVSDFFITENILKHLGFVETISFSKKRSVYRVCNSYLYIDELFGVGLFIEIEGLERDIIELTNVLRECIEVIDKTYLEICLETSSCRVINECL